MLLKDGINVSIEGRSARRRMFLNSEADECRNNKHKSEPGPLPHYENAIVDERGSIPSAVADG